MWSDALPSATRPTCQVALDSGLPQWCLLSAGLSLLSAIWVPNIEFIFGLTGATASVLLSYILPAFAFIKVLDFNPELLGGGNFKVMPNFVRYGTVVAPTTTRRSYSLAPILEEAEEAGGESF